MQDVVGTYTLLFAMITVFVAAVYLVYIIRRKELLNILPMIASLVTVFLVYRVIAVAGATNYYNLLSLDMCLALMATIVSIFYISRPAIFIPLLILMLAGVMIYLNAYPGNNVFTAMFAIGTIYGLIYREFVLNPRKEKKEARKRDREINRDVIQILLGAALFGAVYYFQGSGIATIIAFALIMLGYLGNNLLANIRISSIYKRARDLERKDVSYGLGAVYLAASAALMLGFTHTVSLLLFGIIAVFFGDSVATIVGLSARNATALPYNRFKTMIGTLAFFIVVAVLGYFVIGLYAIPLALVLAFVESFNISLDDNIRSGILVVILGALLGL